MNQYTLDSFRYWMVPVLQDSETGKISPSQVRAGYLTLIAVLRFWESDRSGAPSPLASILGLITCRFQSIILKLQFKWYWIWLLKWLL
ncbi:unnamed protein product [Rhizophagus irregularis]|nr:unnamed protein product [Rhizophagus irregularis]